MYCPLSQASPGLAAKWEDVAVVTEVPAPGMKAAGAPGHLVLGGVPFAKGSSASLCPLTSDTAHFQGLDSGLCWQPIKL